jgi:hypothetical protein
MRRLYGQVLRPPFLHKANVNLIVWLVQRRMSLAPKRMTAKIYGIVSDGVDYQFLRLEGRQLLVSDYYRSIGHDFVQTYVRPKQST